MAARCVSSSQTNTCNTLTSADALDNAVLGSLSLVVGRSMGSSRRLPEWPDEGTDGALRDVPEERPVTPLGFVPRGFGNASSSGFGGGGSSSPLPPSFVGTGTDTPVESQSRRGPWRDLDEFYGDADDVESDEEDVEEESEEESEEDTVGANAPLVPGSSAQDRPSLEDEESEDDNDSSDEEEESTDDDRYRR